MVAPENLADDPLRILRGYRQSAQLGFEIENLTRQVLVKLAPRLKSVAAERVRTELGYLLSMANGSHRILDAIADHVLDDWLPPQSLNLERFAKIEDAISRLVAKFPSLQSFFDRELSGDRSALVIVKLAALTNSANALDSLGLSRTEQRWLLGTLRYLPQFINLIDNASFTEQYKLFQPTLEFFPALATLAMASNYDFDKIIVRLD